MSRKRYRLTQALEHQICSYLRSGGFPWVAAAAAGIPLDVFEAWLRSGSADGARDPYRQFVRAIAQAIAQARLRAEVSVFQDHPRDWLRYGPGKETDEAPGWSAAPRQRSRPRASRSSPLEQPEVLALARAMLEALTPYPEAREKAADAFRQLGLPVTKPAP